MDDERKRIIVTGGAGFIGSAVCRHLLARKTYTVCNLDKLTYAGNLASLDSVEADPNYEFAQVDICDADGVKAVFETFRPDAVMHLAAESHVDRSIDGPAVFVQTNVVGTVTLLQAALDYWRGLDGPAAEKFRFHHISTDEVFGDLPFDDTLFREDTPYEPSSPYSASKAASDHFAQAWHRTYGLPVVLSNCSNNYGPFHFPEKLIPLTILNAMEGKELPVYGAGDNVRDWLFVEDHATALERVMQAGRPGRSYNVGGNAERTNLEVVEAICDMLDEKLEALPGGPRRNLVRFVTDRPGHDRRYAIDATRIRDELDWEPSVTFEQGLSKTIDWYLNNEAWWQPLRKDAYGGARLGTLSK